MRILAIDASTKSTGWAVFNDDKLESYGCLTATSNDLIKRIYKMIDGLEEIISVNNVDRIVMEEVRPEQGLQNLKTQKALMYLQAAIAFLLYDNFPKIIMEFVYPNEWRKLCGIKTGSGVRRETLKPLDIAFVKNQYGISVNDDIADAIGIGHAYCHPDRESNVNNKKTELAWGSTF